MKNNDYCFKPLNLDLFVTQCELTITHTQCCFMPLYMLLLPLLRKPLNFTSILLEKLLLIFKNQTQGSLFLEIFLGVPAQK